MTPRNKPFKVATEAAVFCAEASRPLNNRMVGLPVTALLIVTTNA